MNMTIQQLAAASKCAAKNDVRTYLNGVCVKSDRLWASDGYKAIEIITDTGLLEDVVIIPLETVQAFLKLVKNVYKHYSPSVYVGATSLSAGDLTLPFTPINGRFPELSRVLVREWPDVFLHHCNPKLLVDIWDALVLLDLATAKNYPIPNHIATNGAFCWVFENCYAVVYPLRS